MKSIIKQLYTILLVTVACLTVAGCSDDFSSRIFDREEWRRTDELYDYREERRSKDTDF